MNFIVKPYDTIDEAIELFARHNATAAAEREYTEDELTRLTVQKIRRQMEAPRRNG